MDPKYKIGVPEMDEQHSKLLDLVDAAYGTTGDEFEMNTLMLKLLGYATLHLDEEEAMFRREGLEEFGAEHLKFHEQFRHQAMDFYDQFREAMTLDEKRAVVSRVAEFCEGWLIQHINVEDRKYADLLKKKKEG